jgi:hypothetical protein
MQLDHVTAMLQFVETVWPGVSDGEINLRMECEDD